MTATVTHSDDVEHPDFANIMPRPVTIESMPGAFALDTDTTLSGDPGACAWLRTRVGSAIGLPLEPAMAGSIDVRVDAQRVPNSEGYRLLVTEERVLLVAHDPAGAHYGVQTLRQLLGPAAFRSSAAYAARQRQLPCGIVVDHPRFRWRGCHLDVARHFLPKRDVLRYIELLAAHKLNVLHLHLTDDQGWRVEVPRFPELTRIGAWRRRSMVGRGETDLFDDRPHGGYYTSADLAEIVAYAAEHHITVVPEVDVPGHSQAAIAAYPELGNDPARQLDVWSSWGVNEHVLNVEEATVEFYCAVFDHLLEIFPAEVICIGGDEVPTTEWEQSSRAVRRATELGLRDPAQLHGWFLRRISEHLHARGRRAMSWDEILDVGAMLPPGVLVASWRGETGGVRAASAGHDVVMCPEEAVYLDHRQSDDPAEPIPVGYRRTLADVYRYEPVPADMPAAAAGHTVGAQAQLWTEHLDSARAIDYAAFPRLCAFAEVVWTPREQRDCYDFHRRMNEHHFPRLDALGVEYRPPAGPWPWQTRPGVAGRPLSVPTAEGVPSPEGNGDGDDHV